jgi:chaperonin GroEL (HSP60 family)
MEHPVANLLVKAITQQELECGDGTNRVALYIHSLQQQVTQLSSLGLHPTTITIALRRAFNVWHIMLLAICCSNPTCLTHTHTHTLQCVALVQIAMQSLQCLATKTTAALSHHQHDTSLSSLATQCCIASLRTKIQSPETCEVSRSTSRSCITLTHTHVRARSIIDYASVM